MSKISNFVHKIISSINLNKEKYISQWNNPVGTKTKYFIVDDLIDEEDCKNIYNSFNLKNDIWKHHSTFREKKSTTAKIDTLDPIVPTITDSFQTTEVVDCISKITGINNLEPDHSLYAGGISTMTKDDFLNPHIDNSHNATRTHFRRLNLLFYVSPNWNTEKGGNFELWDSYVKTPKTIVSKFNRLVVMETGPTTYHSVNPVKVEEFRCCVSNYYFSKQSFNKKKYYHVTSFTGRPGQHIQRAYGIIDNNLRNFISNNIGLKRLQSQKILR